MANIYTVPNATSGMDEALIDVVSGVPSFIPGFLIFVFLVVFLGGMNAQRKRLGTTDMPMWAVMASIATLLISLLLSLKEGLMQIEILGIVIGLTVASGLWLFLDRRSTEV